MSAFIFSLNSISRSSLSRSSRSLASRSRLSRSSSSSNLTHVTFTVTDCHIHTHTYCHTYTVTRTHTVTHTQSHTHTYSLSHTQLAQSSWLGDINLYWFCQHISSKILRSPLLTVSYKCVLTSKNKQTKRRYKLSAVPTYCIRSNGSE